MVKKSRSSVMGLTKLKNKVSRNAFDLSHRHMFTAQIGELLPVLCEWVNPNESFKIGYNGMTRTAPLNTAAFTRLRENVQYFFVPFQSLWKYFEQSVNNMTTGQSLQDISMVASSLEDSMPLLTKMPYINYNSLVNVIKLYYNSAVDAVDKYFKTLSSPSQATAQGFYDHVISRNNLEISGYPHFFNQVFFNGVYRYVASAKLFNSLGYGNFSAVITHDVFAQAFEFAKELPSFDKVSFLASSYALNFDQRFTHSPNLSVFPLLAYHKIVNDFYRLRNWQSYESWKSNIDYVNPRSVSYDLFSYTNSDTFKSSNIFDLEFSNLPLDYFTGVLPRPQYGDESAVPLSTDSNTIEITNPLLYNSGGFDAGATITTANSGTSVGIKAGLNSVQSLSGTLYNSSPELKISSLRSAIALQKYKEIQNSNDWSFEEQVLAHFGVKASCDIHKSQFIGGSDSTISISPQINSNFADGAMPDIKAIGESNLHCSCSFKSDTYGVIIGIYRCVPQLDFAHVGIDRCLYKTDASDFPIPELDSIGMQTSYRSEVAAPAVGKPADNSTVDLSATYGYAPRYAELKTSYDRYDGGFNGSFSDWVTGLDTSLLDYWFTQGIDNNYLYDLTNLFICRPNLCYPIFLNNWSGTCNDDKLLVASVNSVTAVRPFSVHGLPWSN